ncbi:MAG: TRAP transporter small permease [Rhizobiales bacterium]|nr:TRAP transporter small permease [Hyphomicrobiales bacterium]
MDALSQFQQQFDRILTVLSDFFKLISGLCLIVIVATFAWLVYGRYILNSTPTWVEQLALILVVVITFFSSAVGLKEKTHLSVDILPYMVPPKPRAIIYMVINIMLIWFGYMMAVNSYKLAIFNWTTEIPLLDVPLSVRSMPLVISGILICLFSFNNLLKYIIYYKTGIAPDNEDENQNPLLDDAREENL